MRLNLSAFRMVALIAAIILATTGVPAVAKNVNRVVMATGPLSSGYYLLGGGICAQVNAVAGGVRCAIETSKGTVANLQALQAGQVDIILAQSDWQHHAHAGSVTPFSGNKALKNSRALMSLTGSPLVILAPARADISALQDLAGKSIDIGKPGAGRRAAMDDVLAALGWDLGKFKLASELLEAEAIKALCGGKLDALALTGATPNKDVAQAMKICPMKIVPIKGDIVTKLLTDKPYYSAVSILKGSYPGVTQDVPSIGLRVILLASDSVPEKDAHDIVKAVAGNLEALRKLHISFTSIERVALGRAGISAPLHDGAAKYYREAKQK